MAEAKWYVVHTYSGYENKVKTNIEKAIEAYRKKHDTRRDLTAGEMDYFFNQYSSGRSDLVGLIYDVFRFGYWAGFQHGRRAAARRSAS